MNQTRGRAKRAGGLAILAGVGLSFLLLLVSPLVENPLGRYLDDRVLAGVDARIEAVRKGPVRITVKYSDGSPASGQEIGFNQVSHDFIFGCNLFEFNRLPDEKQNQLYQKYFLELFNLAVLPFYWRDYEPAPGRFPTAGFLAEAMTWCGEHNLILKGHPLAWRNPTGCPAWLPADEQKVRELLKTRIQDVLAEYGDRIQLWDVVNEPIHLPPFGFESTFEYVRSALAWARASAPAARLTVNDYGILGHDFGHGPYYRLISRLVRAGAPIGCIGLQGREPRTDWVPAYEMRATLDAYSRLGLPLHVTEITVPSSGLPITNSWKKGVWTEEAQAEYLERLYQVCFSHPAVGGIIYWDLYDGRSWIQSGGLVDETWKPKPAYQRLSRLINEQWRSRGRGQTDARGGFEFIGFYGAYEIEFPGLGQTFLIEARKGREKDFTLILDAGPPG